MCKFVLFGPFYSKIGLDPCITVVRETKKNMHLHIPSSSSITSLFTIEGLCPVDFIHQKKPVRACGKVYVKILSGAKLGHSYGYIITNYADGSRWSMLCPGNLILSMPALTFCHTQIKRGSPIVDPTVEVQSRKTEVVLILV